MLAKADIIILGLQPSENLTLGWLVASFENLTERDGGLRSEGPVLGAGSLTSSLHRPAIVAPGPRPCVMFWPPCSRCGAAHASRRAGPAVGAGAWV